MHYSQAVDMWSVGCVYAEMLLGRPLFPGTSSLDQVVKILELIGRPPEGDVASVKSSYALTMIEMLPPLRPVSFAETFPTAGAEAMNLLQQCLTFKANPGDRCSVGEALRHPYVAEFHDPGDEPSHAGTLVLPLDDFTLHEPHEYRNAIYDTIFKRKVEARKRDKFANVNPKKVILTAHDETLPEPF